MSERTKSFLYSLLFGAVIAVGVFLLGCSRFMGDGAGVKTLLRCLCDAAFVPAVILLGVGGIKAMRNKGLFDVVGYGLSSTVQLFIPALKRQEKEDLYQYRERKEASRKPADGMMLAGVAYLAASALLLVIYTLVG